jgi:hypothetical protein
VKNVLMRILIGLGRALRRIFNTGVPLKFVVILCAAVGLVTYYRTHDTVLKQVGGKEDFAEAQRYIEIKDLLDEKELRWLELDEIGG